MTTTPALDVEHRPDCKGADLHTFRGSRGDQMLRCGNCRRFRPLDTDEAPQLPPSQPRPQTRQARLPDLAHPDTHDARQASRNGSAWPTHRARRRFARRRRLNRLRYSRQGRNTEA